MQVDRFSNHGIATLPQLLVEMGGKLPFAALSTNGSFAELGTLRLTHIVKRQPAAKPVGKFRRNTGARSLRSIKSDTAMASQVPRVRCSTM
jgi:hypothetical protein